MVRKVELFDVKTVVRKPAIIIANMFGETCPTMVCKQLGISKGYLSRAFMKLQNAGLVVMTKQVGARKYFVLTPKGEGMKLMIVELLGLITEVNSHARKEERSGCLPERRQVRAAKNGRNPYGC